MMLILRADFGVSLLCCDTFVVIGSKASDNGLRGEVWNRQFGSPRYQQASIFSFLGATP
jgi:hypothetical protein